MFGRKKKYGLFHPFEAGLAGGLICGTVTAVAVFVPLVTQSDYGMAYLQLLFSIYPGFDSVNLMGVVIGFIYSFIDGFIALYAFGWLYNALTRRKKKKRKWFRK